MLILCETKERRRREKKKLFFKILIIGLQWQRKLKPVFIPLTEKEGSGAN